MSEGGFAAWSYSRKEILERFWARAEQPAIASACWIWRGAVKASGYGQMTVSLTPKRKVVSAHRLAWLLINGEIGDMCVLHRCDNPLCVNPDHLFLGTILDNWNDCVAKGRAKLHLPNGRPRNTVLGLASVNEIRALHDGGLLSEDLALRFGVTGRSIRYILSRETWRE